MWFKASKNEKLKAKAREDYEEALAVAKSNARESRVYCVRVALRCRANIDTAFVRAAREVEVYEETLLLALANGAEKPEPPQADTFQLVKSGADFMFTYIPERFAEKIFSVAGAYQTQKIAKSQAITQVQAVADEMWKELGLIENLEVVRFLREEAGDESGSGDAADPGNHDG